MSDSASCSRGAESAGSSPGSGPFRAAGQGTDRHATGRPISPAPALRGTTSAGRAVDHAALRNAIVMVIPDPESTLVTTWPEDARPREPP
ncbi:hypothetical protein [Parafrankia sp. FMc2]|uniref:hypothetical protein n=1 Tax=Parafrankia sp. FMc2 TaxID=3233196 RepID=UPI0034D49607